jgi:hypothetical protein
MARTITITLQAGAGADLGPFNMSVSSGTITPTTATRAELLAGKVFTISSDPAVNVTATSTGTCTNSASVTAGAVVTSFAYSVGVYNFLDENICSSATNITAFSSSSSFTIGMTLFSDGQLTSPLTQAYVIFNGTIYNMSGGEVGSDTGVTC